MLLIFILMFVSIDYSEDMRFIATVNREHGVIVDGDRIIAPSAMDFLLVGLGSCTAIDVVSILKKMRENFRTLKVEVNGERSQDFPKVYTKVTLKYIVYGKVDEENLKKAIELSQNKYCSASIMFKRSGTELEYSYEIID